MNEKAKFLDTTAEQKERIQEIREMFSDVYNSIEAICHDSREKSLAMTKLEEAQFWAIKSITREKGATA